MSWTWPYNLNSFEMHHAMCFSTNQKVIPSSINAAPVLLIWLLNSGQGRGGAFGRLRGGGDGGRGRGNRRGRGRGRGHGRGRGEKVSAEDLDADLEKYHAESMQLN